MVSIAAVVRYRCTGIFIKGEVKDQSAEFGMLLVQFCYLGGGQGAIVDSDLVYGPIQMLVEMPE